MYKNNHYITHNIFFKKKLVIYLIQIIRIFSNEIKKLPNLNIGINRISVAVDECLEILK